MKSIGRRSFLATGLAGGAHWLLGSKRAAAGGRCNVLFIAVDDLRPELGCYGAEHMKTPHIDALAASGVQFNRAYCQQAVCSPSRTSLMTGLRPDTTKIYDLQTHFRTTIPDAVTLPQRLMEHGYRTESLGKIYHGGLDDPASWSAESWHPPGPGYGKPETLDFLERERERLRGEFGGGAVEVLERDPKTGQALRVSRPKYRVRGPSWEDPDVADNALPDGKTADEAIRRLRALKDERFFLAVGFYKPHLPFVAPRKYFDLYPEESIRPPAHPAPPEGVPDIAMHNWGELRNYSDIPRNGPLADEQVLDLRRAYYASCSYTDAQIGRVLDELNRLGLRDNTLVVLWGDHGWHLGENDLWCKHSNFEYAARAPLIVRAPGLETAGRKTDGLAEFVDIYPTICDWCGVPAPAELEGTSLVPLIREPDRPWKKAAFSQYPRGRSMGYSIRTDRYRYTEWQDAEGNAFEKELYDHERDPGETANLANRPEHRDTANRLGGILNAGWRGALPE